MGGWLVCRLTVRLVSGGDVNKYKMSIIKAARVGEEEEEGISVIGGMVWVEDAPSSSVLAVITNCFAG